MRTSRLRGIVSGTILILLASLGFLAIRGALADCSDCEEERSVPEPEIATENEALVRIIPRLVGAKSSGPAGNFSDGQWTVGDDILPGKYQTLDATDVCYWERLSDWSGCISDTIEDGDVDGKIGAVDIAASDMGFATEGCGTWERISD